MAPSTWRRFSSTALACCVVALLLVAYSAVRRLDLLAMASQRRLAAAESRLRISRLELRLQMAAARIPRLAVQLEVGERAEKLRVARLRRLTRELTQQRQRRYEQRWLGLPASSSGSGGGGSSSSSGGSSSSVGGGPWHARGPGGECPSGIPDWDWQLLLRAAEAGATSSAREAALSELADRSGVGQGAC